MYKIFTFIGIVLLASCSNLLNDTKEIKYVKDPYNPNRMITVEEAEKIGTLDLKFVTKDNQGSLGKVQKNYFLWSACVDVLSDLPPKISDASGGIFVTDYISLDNGKKQAIKCRILGDKILSSNLDIKVYTILPDGTQLKPSENNDIKSNVLIRARELKAQYDGKI